MENNKYGIYFNKKYNNEIPLASFENSKGEEVFIEYKKNFIKEAILDGKKLKVILEVINTDFSKINIFMNNVSKLLKEVEKGKQVDNPKTIKLTKLFNSLFDELFIIINE